MGIISVGVIVTCGASGLGGATAKMLADRGAKVAIFDLNEEVGKAHAESIGGLFVRVNVSDEASVEAGLAAAEAGQGVAPIWVNCAGLAPAIRTAGRDINPNPRAFNRTGGKVNRIGPFTLLSNSATLQERRKGERS